MRQCGLRLQRCGTRDLCVEPFQPRTLETLRKVWWTFFVQCGAMFYEPEVRGGREKLSPIFREFLAIAEVSGPLTATELLNAWAEMDLLRSKTLEEMREYPVLLCPVASVPAWRHGERKWMIDGQTVEYLDAVRYTQWFNTLGCAGGGGAGGTVAGGIADRSADGGATV